MSNSCLDAPHVGRELSQLTHDAFDVIRHQVARALKPAAEKAIQIERDAVRADHHALLSRLDSRSKRSAQRRKSNVL
jgi:hypothetical protein